MINNKDIPDSINQWDIEYDPYGFANNENWLGDAEKTEDILQIQHIYADGPILDVGWCDRRYRVVVIANKDWESPIESLESESTETIKSTVYRWLVKYANAI